MSKTTTIEDIELQIKKLGDQVDSLGRKMGDLTRQVETMDQDRAILEDIQRAIRSLEEALRLNNEHNDTIIKALKTEVQIQGSRTEEGVKEIKEKVEEHIGDLVENIEKKKVVLVKEGIVEKIKNHLIKKRR